MDRYGWVMLGILRRRRLRSRLALLASLGLLCAQMMLAWHAGCFGLHASDAVTMTSTSADHCAGKSDPTERGVCEAHCQQGDQNADGVRVLPGVPALPAQGLAWVVPIQPPDVAASHAQPRFNRAGRHRPTAHPASVLLI